MADDGNNSTENSSGSDKTFTQTQLDDIVKTRVAAEKAKYGDLNELRRKASEFDKLDNANKSDAEKHAARIAELEKDSSAAAIRALKAEVALEKGLTKVQAKRLVGATLEELTADADELLADLKGDDLKKDPTAGQRPKENLKKVDSDATDSDDKTDMNEWMRSRRKNS